MSDLHPVVTATLLDLAENFEKYHRDNNDPQMYKQWKKMMLQYKEK